MKKRIFTLLILLCFSLSLLPSALAAPGDQAFLKTEEVSALFSGEPFVQDILLVEDTLYFLFQSAIYRAKIGDEKPELFLQFLPEEMEGQIYPYTSLKDAEKQLGDITAHSLINTLFYWQGQLYAYNQYAHLATPIDIKTGSLLTDQALSLPPVSKDENFHNMNRAYQGVFGDEFFIIDELYSASFFYRLSSINLKTLEKTVYNQKLISGLSAYQGDQLLALVQTDFSKPYNEENPEETNPQFALFSPETDELQPLYHAKNPIVQNPAYSAQNNSIYYLSYGDIIQKSLNSGEENTVGYRARDGGFRPDAQKGWITPQGLYVYYNGSDEGTIVKNVDPANRPTVTLSIYNGFPGQHVIDTFNQPYPDVPVLLSQGQPTYTTPEDLAQAIQANTLKGDLIVIEPQLMNFKALMAKGFAYPLEKSAALTQAAQDFYPFITNSLSHEGQLYALPLDASLYIPRFYNEDTIREMSLTPEDMPATFMELIAFASRWADQMHYDYPDYSFFSGSPKLYQKDLADLVMDAYTASYEQKGETLTFDTPLFRKLMEAITALDLPKTYDPSRSDDAYYEDTDDDNALFPNSFRDYALPLDKGEHPAIAFTPQLIFINPNSPNKQMALALMEAVAAAYSDTEKIVLYQNENNPVKNPYYDEYVKTTEEELAALTEQVKTLSEEEKPPVLEEIEHFNQLLTEKEDIYWSVNEGTIAAYNGQIPYMYLPTQPSPYNPWDENNNISKLFNDYISGSISLEDFITTANQRIQMGEMENQ